MEIRPDIEKAALMVLRANTVEIRDVPQKVTNEEVGNLPRENQPFLYASGNWGPIYVMIKALVAYGQVIPILVEQLTLQIIENFPSLDYVAGNITGGVIPGWQLSEELSTRLKKEIDFIYVGGTRKKEEDGFPAITLIDRIALEQTAYELYRAIIQSRQDFDFVAGLVPSGMIPGYRLSQVLSAKLNRIVPFVYIRQWRKTGGQKERITGATNNPYLPSGSTGIVIGQVEDFFRTTHEGMEVLHEEGFKTISGAELLAGLGASAVTDIRNVQSTLNRSELLWRLQGQGIVVEELVNFAQTTCHSAGALRSAGCAVNHAATILFYDNPEAIRMLQEHNIEMTYLLTLPELVAVAEKHQIFPQGAIDGYREFSTDPLGWQVERGLKPIERGGTL